MSKGSDCSKNFSLKFVALVQVATLVALLAYLFPIQKEYSAFAKQYANMSKVDVNNPQQFNALCSSKRSLDNFIKFENHYKATFYTIVICAILNLLFLSFSSHLPDKTILALCLLLFVGGAIALGYAADGLRKIQQDLSNEPPECKRLFNNLKKFFIVGIVVSSTQILVGMHTGFTSI